MGNGSWVVKLDEESIDSASLGDPIQVVVSADSPEEAKKLAADLLETEAESLEAVPFTIGG